MNFNKACKALEKEGAQYSNPLFYAYFDGYYEAKTSCNPTPAKDYTGVSTIEGYFKSAEVCEHYARGLVDGMKSKIKA